jgi:hypothetical protein
VSSRPRVLVVHGKVQPHGGACGVLAWALQALYRDYQVTLLTSEPFELAALNRFFGTSIEAQDVRVKHIHPMLRKILALDPDPGSIQKNCYLMRMAKRMRSDFDCVLATDNEVDFGDPAVQYFHVPHLAHVYHKLRKSGAESSPSWSTCCSAACVQSSTPLAASTVWFGRALVRIARRGCPGISARIGPSSGSGHTSDQVLPGPFPPSRRLSLSHKSGDSAGTCASGRQPVECC